MIKKLLLMAVALLSCYAKAQFTGLPVTLSQPYDREVLENDEPLLVWQTDLSTVIDNPRVSMRLTVVEVQQDQTPAEAMQVNAPILLRDELKSNTWSYSSTDTELLPGHHYAWQVIIFYNQVAVQQSEVWEFSIKISDEPEPGYVIVRKHADLSYHTLSKPVLYFMSDEPGSLLLNGSVSGRGIVDSQVAVIEIKQGKELSQSVSGGMGPRYFKADLTSLNLPAGNYDFRWNYSEKKSCVIHITVE